MLVVIGIIALLVSILLPSLNRARENAKQIKCLSNLKQIGMAMMMYIDENQGDLPWVAPYTAFREDDWIWWEQAGQPAARLAAVGHRAVHVAAGEPGVLPLPLRRHRRPRRTLAVHGLPLQLRDELVPASTTRRRTPARW